MQADHEDPAMAHLDPLPREDIDDHELQVMLERYLRIRKFIPNSVLTMARRPGIAKAFAALNQAILYEGSVPEETKMLAALIRTLLGMNFLIRR